ncbi:MAG: ABC-F family ATP-binding cassette domain-containing protein [Candidatus Spyradocola sp.]|jgi:ATP-binding cassette subfamily F protein 3
MIVLQTNQLTKSFGVVEVLKGVTLTVQDHHRVGLVGSNGSGKSTLLKILYGQDAYDGGTLSMTRGLRIGFHTQLDDLTSQRTVWQEMETCFEYTFKMEERLREMEHRMGEIHDSDPAGFQRLSEDYAKLTDRFEEEDGYSWRSRLQGVLTGLGFTQAQYEQTVSSLSGGERTRLKLGKLLLTKTDLLLLDEPTNHLDLASIAWLEDYLRAYKGAVIVVSHDRYFLDAVCNSIAELSFGRVEQYEGNYTRYLKLREEVMVRRMKEYTLQQKEIAREEAIIAQFRAYNTEAAHIKAKSREKRLNMIERVDKPVEEHNVYFSFHAGRGTGNDVLMVEDLTKSYGPRKLFGGLNLHVRAGDRIALLGANGVGKTTLLRILMGLEAPDSGSVRFGSGVEVGYYDQQQEGLSPEKDVLNEVWDDFPRMEQTTIRNALAGFLFTGDDVFAQVGTLSGGERGRVLLTKLMLRQDNFLILDEPTNHLDMDSREMLETALLGFEGTILTVSHDRYFINRIADRVVVMEPDGVTEYIGNYDDYLEKSAQKALPDEEETQSKTKTALREEKKREKAAQEAARREKERIANLETRITDLEEQMTQMEIEMSDPDTYADIARAQALSKRYAEMQAKVADLYEQWEAAQ